MAPAAWRREKSSKSRSPIAVGGRTRGRVTNDSTTTRSLKGMPRTATARPRASGAMTRGALRRYTKSEEDDPQVGAGSCLPRGAI